MSSHEDQVKGGFVNKQDHYVPYYPPASQDQSFIQTIIAHPIGALGIFGTVGVLAGGLYSMVSGATPLQSNKLMRGRVISQFATVGVVAGGMFWALYGRTLAMVTNPEEKK